MVSTSRARRFGVAMVNQLRAYTSPRALGEVAGACLPRDLRSLDFGRRCESWSPLAVRFLAQRTGGRARKSRFGASFGFFVPSCPLALVPSNQRLAAFSVRVLVAPGGALIRATNKSKRVRGQGAGDIRSRHGQTVARGSARFPCPLPLFLSVLSMAYGKFGESSVRPQIAVPRGYGLRPNACSAMLRVMPE